MNSSTKLLCLAIAIATLSSCASIVSKSNWPVTFHSNPVGANITITNKKGIEVYSGKTPATMKLKSGSGFFGKESYTVVLNLDGYEAKTLKLDCKLNGWYFGNILFGGLIGLLIVDPATGAMYKLDKDFIEETLSKGPAATTQATGNQPSLQILNKDEVPASWSSHMVKL
ncbi:hypothetical protein D3H65_07895 [Paraflavitalea soli]|uniref:PEGA domain-containing protein n=1 Tax=Paraflavitalea soli TaxID=2315862 RepID=A0A3B7MLR5_9BACT|nr:hypothetical protein [Paraflavitalea soli]AXY73906.1 hypothetical protein D3H65_07895 [Paraflavitalea soli]